MRLDNPPANFLIITLNFLGLFLVSFYSAFNRLPLLTPINPRPINPLSVLSGEAEYPDIDKLLDIIKGLSSKTWIINATDEAQKLGNVMSANILLIGSLLALKMLPLDNKEFEPVIREKFPKAIDVNLRAFKRGEELVTELIS